MTPNFATKELACKCGCGMLPDREFMERVQRLRDELGFSLPVTSAARCPKHNQAVSATGANGPHTTGRAIDIGVRGEQAIRLIKAALNAGFTGIGIQQKGASRFIHLDDLAQGRPNIWSY